MEPTELLDMARLMERLEGDKELMGEIFEVFVEEAPGRVERLEAALAEADIQAVVHWAHSLKGTSGTLQAEPLRDSCLALEMAARASDAEQVKALASGAIDLLQRTAAHIATLKAAL